MSFGIPPQVIAVGAALSYAASGIAAKRGLRYSTPITVTLVSVTIHAVALSAAVLLTGGIPVVSWWVLFLFALTGTLQPIIRLFTYAGIHYIGASRGTTLRGAHPLFSTSLAIIFLGEQATLPVIAVPEFQSPLDKIFRSAPTIPSPVLTFNGINSAQSACGCLPPLPHGASLPAWPHHHRRCEGPQSRWRPP